MTHFSAVTFLPFLARASGISCGLILGSASDRSGRAPNRIMRTMRETIKYELSSHTLSGSRHRVITFSLFIDDLLIRGSKWMQWGMPGFQRRGSFYMVPRMCEAHPCPDPAYAFS